MTAQCTRRYSLLGLVGFYGVSACWSDSVDRFGWTLGYCPTETMQERFEGQKGHRHYCPIDTRAYIHTTTSTNETRKPSWRWQTRATRRHAKIAPIRRVSFHFTESHFAKFQITGAWRHAIGSRPRPIWLYTVWNPVFANKFLVQITST